MVSSQAQVFQLHAPTRPACGELGQNRREEVAPDAGEDAHPQQGGLFGGRRRGCRHRRVPVPENLLRRGVQNRSCRGEADPAGVPIE